MMIPVAVEYEQWFLGKQGIYLICCISISFPKNVRMFLHLISYPGSNVWARE